MTAFDNQAGLNGLQFFIQLLTNLQLVDKTAKLLPCDVAPKEFRALRSVDDIPKDGSVERFVNCYLDGLKSTGTSMKGKFLLNCEAKFDTFKKNILFKSWLTGDGVNYKTQLDRVELSGTTRITVGKFIYAVVRQDFEASFKARLIKKIKVFLAERELLVVPEFAIVCRPLFDRGVQTRVYFMITASSADAMLLKGMIPFLYPPSSVETMFLPTEVWFAMDAKKKSEFFNSHYNFMENHLALILHGIKDMRQLIFPNEEADQPISIKSWLQSLKMGDEKFKLFRKVYQGSKGGIELWVHVSNSKEAKVWLATALYEIATLSRLNMESTLAAEMFIDPPSVSCKMQWNLSGITLPDQVKLFSDFSHVSAAAISRPANKKAHRVQYKKIQISFDTVAPEVAVPTANALPPKKRSGRGSRKKKRNTGDGAPAQQQSAPVDNSMSLAVIPAPAPFPPTYDANVD